MIDYLRYLWQLCGHPVLAADEEFREMLIRAGWKEFMIEHWPSGGATRSRY
jgi:hypothetical protein